MMKRGERQEQRMAKQFLIDLLNRMTLEEKLGQMTQLYPGFFGVEESMDLTGPLNELKIKKEWLPLMGSTLNSFGAKKNREMQKKHLQESRLKIPLIFMADVIHGYKTVFPIGLALGCSFRPQNYEIASKIAAAESSVSGIQVTFSPMADLVRDPRWGRVMESTGEDPYLNARMTEASVKGFQGEDYRKDGQLASCVKHFAGYGACEGGRDYNTVDMSWGSLREFYLSAYEAAVKAGAAMVMTSFNLVDRTPASANKKLLRDILRDEWKFQGTTISDFAAVDETITHGYARDGAEACEKCIQAGVDIEMMSSHYMNHAKELIKEGRLSMDLIDEAVMRILELKESVGLFEDPYKNMSEEGEKELHGCQSFREAARKVARECPVLLKNTGVLPLKAGMKIGLAGPFVKSNDTLGGWTIEGGIGESNLLAGLREVFPDAEYATAMTEELGSMHQGIYDVRENFDEIWQNLKDCDVLIAAVGENTEDTGEAASKTDLRLTPNQEKMIREMKKLEKPVVVVIFSGRPLEIKPVLEDADAVLQAWFLGTESGKALADILTGKYNPSGRLSISFPQTVGQIPVYYNFYNTGRPIKESEDRYVSRYLDCANKPLFGFGYGLSYSEFVYSNLEVEDKEDVITVSVKVKNVSGVSGKETVQCYIRDMAASVVRPVKELKDFEQIEFKAFEEKEVVFRLGRDSLSFWNAELEYVWEPGEFEIMVGKNSEDVLVKRILIKK